MKTYKSKYKKDWIKALSEAMVLFLEKESNNLIIQLGFNFKEKRGYQAVISNDVTDIADFWNEGV
jgi:hypothetical protein